MYVFGVIVPSQRLWWDLFTRWRRRQLCSSNFLFKNKNWRRRRRNENEIQWKKNNELNENDQFQSKMQWNSNRFNWWLNTELKPTENSNPVQPVAPIRAITEQFNAMQCNSMQCNWSNEKQSKNGGSLRRLEIRKRQRTRRFGHCNDSLLIPLNHLRHFAVFSRH